MHKAIKTVLIGLAAVASLPVLYVGGSILAVDCFADVPGHYRLGPITSTRLNRVVLAEDVRKDFSPTAERKTPLSEGEEFNCDVQVVHPAPGDAIEFRLIDQAGKVQEQDRKVIPAEAKNEAFWLDYHGLTTAAGHYTCEFRIGHQTKEVSFEVREVRGFAFAEGVLAEEVDPKTLEPVSLHLGKVEPNAPFICDAKVINAAPGDEVMLSLFDEDGEAKVQKSLVFPKGTSGKVHFVALDGQTEGSGHYTCRFQHGSQVREVPVEVGPSEPSQMRLEEAVLADQVGEHSRPLSLKKDPLHIGEIAICSLRLAEAKKGDVLKVSLLDEHGAALRQEKVAIPHDEPGDSTWAQFKNPAPRAGRYTCRFQHGAQTLEVPFQVASSAR